MARNRDVYSTGVQDQLAAATRTGDKDSVIKTLRTVLAEDPELGEALANKVLRDSLAKGAGGNPGSTKP